MRPGVYATLLRDTARSWKKTPPDCRLFPTAKYRRNLSFRRCTRRTSSAWRRRQAGRLGPDRIHEMRHDRCRMLVITRSSRRAALPERDRLQQALSVDCRGRAQGAAEAFRLRWRSGILGIDGISDFNALHSCKHEHQVQLYAFDVLAMAGNTSGSSHCTCARQPRTAVSSPAQRNVMGLLFNAGPLFGLTGDIGVGRRPT